MSGRIGIDELCLRGGVDRIGNLPQGLPAVAVGWPMGRHRRKARLFQRLGLAQLFVEITPFGHHDPGLARGEHGVDGGVAAARYDPVSRSDPLGRIVYPAQMGEIAGRGFVPFAGHLAEREPMRMRVLPRAERERGTGQAFAAAAADHADDPCIKRQAQRAPGIVAAGKHRHVDTEAGRIVGLGQHPCRSVILFEHPRIRRDDPHRAFVSRHVPDIAAPTVLQDCDMRDRT